MDDRQRRWRRPGLPRDRGRANVLHTEDNVVNNDGWWDGAAGIMRDNHHQDNQRRPNYQHRNRDQMDRNYPRRRINEGGRFSHRRGRNNDGPQDRQDFREHHQQRRGGDRNIHCDRPILGFKRLESWLVTDLEDLTLELLNNSFNQFTRSELTPDTIILVVAILGRVCDSSFDESKTKVLQMSLNEEFLDTLIKYIATLPMNTQKDKNGNKYFWNNTDGFWNNLIKISRELIDTIQTSACEILPKLIDSLLTYLPLFEQKHNIHISDEILTNIEQLQVLLMEKQKKYDEFKKREKESRKIRIENEEPPDDFRQISVYPLSSELLSDRGFLRPNVIEGPYKDVNHYLDVQFRLLREDFVGPLRSGINSYFQSLNNTDKKKKNRLANVRIHKDVVFLKAETINESYCMRIQYDSSNKKKNFKYENSKRFMFGSLLCFTSDHFKDLIFGRVAVRKIEDLEKGELVVAFDENVVVNFDRKYLMVECTVYFEPYFHVLNGVKTMSVDNFPMERYIVRVENHVLPPSYLSENPSINYTIRHQTFNPLYNWPETNFYDFNPSQQVAFKGALTEEFCIIQGPPGTGKTFLGLKIAKTLLQNKSAWYKKTPMLVICYTNHALDQFLEGLLDYTKEIVRVGGQSKNEKLQEFNLRNKQKSKSTSAIYQHRREVQSCLSEIKRVTENLNEINSYKSVRDFSVFQDVVPNFSQTWFCRAKRSEILDWLLEGSKQIILNQQNQRDLVQLQRKVDGIKLVDDGVDDESDSDYEDSDNERANELVDDIFREVDAMEVQCSESLLDLQSLKNRLKETEKQLKEIQAIQQPTLMDFTKESELNAEFHTLQNHCQYIELNLFQGLNLQEAYLEVPRTTDLTNAHKMNYQDRWLLYFYWLSLYKAKLNEKLQRLNEQFRDVFKVYEEMRNIEDTNALKNVLVVGMTTTTAARLRSTLQALKSPVVIVEEAAEVLEAHIITSLTNHCKHLILIGDHQQLKPSTSDYYIETNFKLGISLFERMVLNKIQCYTLNVQHRMKPEISCLISPAIYPNLQDHPSTFHRKPIAGIDNCLYFIDHDHAESDCEGTSKKNYHEVGFIIALARHLILNGYKPENITILAAYLGQMFEMQKERKKYKNLLENVRISVLDNYQGEECDIILLSLVRNNEENKIGFLKIDNRVCVALSRARDGMYVMGNMAQLCAASPLWKKIQTTLVESDSLGKALALRCQVHPDIVTHVKSADDFYAISEGGCSNKCGAPLVCGHKCNLLCHVLNRDHKDYKCRHKCGLRLCDKNPEHLCNKMCYQECGPCMYKVQRRLKCGHEVHLECYLDPDEYNCQVLVQTELPCGHVADKPCYCDPKIFRCPHPCDLKVEPCGHACMMMCHVRRDPDHLEYLCKKKCARYRKNCTVKTDAHICRKLCFEECDECEIPVKKRRTACPHVYTIACCEDVNEIECKKPCTKILDCGHKCKSKCFEPCGECNEKVTKIVPECNHPVKIKCHEKAERKHCKQKCPLPLPCGHNCTERCDKECTKDCKQIVDCSVRSSCGHTITKIRCGILNSDKVNDSQILVANCSEPCNETLACEHRCSGTCGNCLQGRIHQRCAEKCGTILVCSHECGLPCREACRPCNLKCEYRCVHSKCQKRCGEICTPCKEPCPRQCEHQKCKKRCYELCDVDPCLEPCKKMLKCGHPCIGFCGDRCPPKCFICDKNEVMEIFFGTEDDETARYVYLEDCKHLVENEGMEQWLKQSESNVSFKECPKCKTKIKTTQRYSNYIKIAVNDIAKVKMRANGNSDDNKQRRDELEMRVKELIEKNIILIYNRKYWKFRKVMDSLIYRLQPAHKGKRQSINKYELDAITSKLQIAEHIIDMISKLQVKASVELFDDMLINQLNLIAETLLRDDSIITNQEIQDINPEIDRLLRIGEFFQIKRTPSFINMVTHNTRVQLLTENLTKTLQSSQKFSTYFSTNVQKQLHELNDLTKSGIGISLSEKREILKAMGLSSGHWFKCPNGHIYAITECGGAMQEGRCNECGAVIGGGHHRLRADNALAPEMDGARFAAWSDIANNMGNWDL